LLSGVSRTQKYQRTLLFQADVGRTLDQVRGDAVGDGGPKCPRCTGSRSWHRRDKNRWPRWHRYQRSIALEFFGEMFAELRTKFSWNCVAPFQRQPLSALERSWPTRFRTSLDVEFFGQDAAGPESDAMKFTVRTPASRSTASSKCRRNTDPLAPVVADGQILWWMIRQRLSGEATRAQPRTLEHRE